nr:hypothetical protein [Tanacetum cinerariifolium]
MIDNIDQDVEITLVDDTQGRMNEEDIFRVNDFNGNEVVVDVSASENVEQSVKVFEKEQSSLLEQFLLLPSQEPVFTDDCRSHYATEFIPCSGFGTQALQNSMYVEIPLG